MKKLNSMSKEELVAYRHEIENNPAHLNSNHDSIYKYNEKARMILGKIDFAITERMGGVVGAGFSNTKRKK